MKSHPVRHSPTYFSDIKAAFKPISKLAGKLSNLVQQARQSYPPHSKPAIKAVAAEIQPPEQLFTAEEDLQNQCEDLIEAIETDVRLITKCRQQIHSADSSCNFQELAEKAAGAMERIKQRERLLDDAVAGMAGQFNVTPARKDVILQDLRDRAADAFTKADRAWRS